MTQKAKSHASQSCKFTVFVITANFSTTMKARTLGIERASDF